MIPLSSLHLCIKSIYPPSAFARVKTMNFAWLPLPKTKAPGLWRRLVLWCPPESTPDPPRGTPRLKLLWAERRCLPASSRTCYSIFMCGFRGRLAHQTQQKVKLKAPPFLDMGARLMFAGVHCHEKKEKKTGTALCSLLWCREWIPLQLVPNVHTKKKIQAHKGSVRYIFCLYDFWL